MQAIQSHFLYFYSRFLGHTFYKSNILAIDKYIHKGDREGRQLGWVPGRGNSWGGGFPTDEHPPGSN